jgi:hypothetical protein
MSGRYLSLWRHSAVHCVAALAAACGGAVSHTPADGSDSSATTTDGSVSDGTVGDSEEAETLGPNLADGSDGSTTTTDGSVSDGTVGDSEEAETLGPSLTMDAGVFDGRITDGNVISEAASPTDAFPQWWDPACATTSGGCTDPGCRPANLSVYSAPCATPTSLQAGCIMVAGITIGWECFVRLSDSALIFTMDRPVSLTGLEPCYEAGVINTQGASFPWCTDL